MSFFGVLFFLFVLYWLTQTTWLGNCLGCAVVIILLGFLFLII